MLIKKKSLAPKKKKKGINVVKKSIYQKHKSFIKDKKIYICTPSYHFAFTF